MGFILSSAVILLLPSLLDAAPGVSSFYTNHGFHTRLEYSIYPDPQLPAKCLFVWHRLPSYLYIEPDELYQLSATIIGSINIETSASHSHPFAYCFILYNSSKISFQNLEKFSINVHSRYLDPAADDYQQHEYETLYLPEPVIHFTEKSCSYLGSGCPAPLSESGIESPRELSVTIPIGQRKHLWFVLPLSSLFPLISCPLLFIASRHININA